jgi:predicted Rossmann-fold nucleotide-binding protein
MKSSINRFISVLLAISLVADFPAHASAALFAAPQPRHLNSIVQSRLNQEALSAKLFSAHRDMGAFLKPRHVMIAATAIVTAPAVASAASWSPPMYVSHPHGMAYLTVVFAITANYLGGNLDELIREFREVEQIHRIWPRAVTVFGSARDLSRQTRKLATALGREAVRLGIPVRGGGGPGEAMEGVPRAVRAAREDAGLYMALENLNQSVRIILPFEQGTNPEVEDVVTVHHFGPRKLGLDRNSFGVFVFPGGIGSLDEMFGVWQRRRRLVLLEPAEGPLRSMWTNIYGGFREAWMSAGLARNMPPKPPITTSPEEALVHLMNPHEAPWMRPGLSWDDSINEFRAAWIRLEKMPHAIVLAGRIGTDTDRRAVYRLAYLLLKAGHTVRVVSRGLVPIVLDAAKDALAVPGQVQAVLFIPPGEKPRQLEIRKVPDLIMLHDPSMHKIASSKRASAHVFAPGTAGTGHHLFERYQLRQIAADVIRRNTATERDVEELSRPKVMLGGKFWKSFFTAIKDYALRPIPLHDPYSDKPLIDPHTHEPRVTTLITPGDESLIPIASTVHEAMDILKPAFRFTRGGGASTLLSLTILLAGSLIAVLLDHLSPALPSIPLLTAGTNLWVGVALMSSVVIGMAAQGHSPEGTPNPNISYALQRPGDTVLRFGMRLRRWVPIFGTRLSSRIRAYQALHDQLSGERQHQLTRTRQRGLEDVATQIAGVPIKIIPNDATLYADSPTPDEQLLTPVLIIRSNQVHLKESVLALGDRDVLAFLIGYGRALIWLQRHSHAARVLSVVPALLGIAPRDQQFDFVAKMLDFTIYYWRLRNAIEPLLRQPPVTVEQLIEIAGAQGADERLIRAAYGVAGKQYRTESGQDIHFPSGKSWFVHATLIARQAAELHQAPAVVAAALLSQMDPVFYERFSEAQLVERAHILSIELGTSYDQAQKIQNLACGLHRLLYTEHFNPPADPPARLPSYRVQYGTQRTLEVAEKIAKKVGADWTELIALWLATKSEQITTFDPVSERDRIDSFYRETIYLNSPLAERLGGNNSVSIALENNVFRCALTEEYKTIKAEMQEATGMDHYQRQAELSRIHALVDEIVKDEIGHRHSRVEISTREKTYARLYWKKIEEFIQALDSSQARTIKLQPDPLAIRIIASSAQVMEILRHAVPGNLMKALGSDAQILRVRRERVRDRIAMELVQFVYPHPEIPGHLNRAELQIATEEGKRVFMIGQSKQSYALPHDQYKAKRHADNLTEVAASDLGSYFFGQQFDHADPRRRGDYTVDARAIKRSQRNTIHPVFSLDPTAITATDLDRVAWQDPIQLPAKAIVADLVFHLNVGGHADHFYTPYRITEVPDPQHPERFLVRRHEVDLIAPLEPGDRIVFDMSRVRNEGTHRKQELYQKVTTARAKLCLYHSIDRPFDPALLEQEGRQIVANEYGSFTEPILKMYALPAVWYWLGLSESEFFQIVALSRINGSRADAHRKTTEIFKAVKTDFDQWMKDRFVQMHVTVIEDTEDTVELQIDWDEDQSGLLDFVLQTLEDKGVVVQEFQRVPPRLTGESTLRLVLLKRTPTDPPIFLDKPGIIQELQHLYRRRGLGRAIEEGERIAIHFVARTSHTVPDVVKRLTAAGARILSLRTEPSTWGRSNVTMLILSPQEFKSFPGRTPFDVLGKEILLAPGRVEISLAPHNYATSEELKSFLISRARQVDPNFWHLFPASLQAELQKPPSIPQARGDIDAIAVQRFKRLWFIVEDFHPAEDNKWAKQQLRKNGAPYLVHQLGITWSELVDAHVSAPMTLYLGMAHELFEDGIPNIIAASDGTLTYEEAKTIVVDRLRTLGPSYFAGWIVRLIDDFTRASHQAYKYTLATIAQSGLLEEIITKCYDEVNNLIDPTDRRLTKAWRYYLDFYRVISTRKDASLKIARGTLLHRILTLDIPLDANSRYYEAREITPRGHLEADRDATAAIDRFQIYARGIGRRIILSDTRLSAEELDAALQRMENYKQILQEKTQEPRRPGPRLTSWILFFFSAHLLHGMMDMPAIPSNKDLRRSA